jgi:hypothetical protein
MTSTMKRLSIVLASIVLVLAAAHSTLACEGHAFVRVEIDELPRELAGMRVEFHKTMGPQLVIDNPTSRTVEVLDDTGVPFVRIGRQGVEGNIASEAWYTTYSPAAVVPASVKRGAKARWVRASTDTSFGWFDQRLDASKTTLPSDVVEASRAADLGAWTVPLRVGGRPVMLRGHFRYVPPPPGAYRVSLTSPPEIAKGVRVRLLPGKVPGLMMQSSSPQPLLVIGADGEPFLRIGPRGVEANLHSPTWWASGRGSADPDEAAVDPNADPQWQRVSHSPRFSWIELRAQGGLPATEDSSGTTTQAWQVPLRLGDEPFVITGEATWEPTADQLVSVSESDARIR